MEVEMKKKLLSKILLKQIFESSHNSNQVCMRQDSSMFLENCFITEEK